MSKSKKVLISNRGEIACRIIKTARKMGFETISIFSPSEASALHTRLADQAIELKAEGIASPYLDVEQIIQIARDNQVDLIHPGYGYLSENPEFSRACEKASIQFVGPGPKSMELMGDKKRARIFAREAGIPCVPGYDGDTVDSNKLLEKAREIGFPLLVKASAGGGGRGIFCVESEDQLGESLQTVIRQVESSFGGSEIILEKKISPARHVEVQILGDGKGGAIHLYERDCSLQRRRQKIIEEAPAPGLDQQVTEAICHSAVKLASACDYLGAGTVEFLVDQEGFHYFLEMNTRIQVEHPVTEMITGVDLIQEQFHLAISGELSYQQEDIQSRGHSVEVRLYAEDPANNFLPQTGPIHFIPPTHHNLRIDHGLLQDQEVQAEFDPMLLKLISYGPSRDEAIKTLISGLNDLWLSGIKTNQHFLLNLLESETFSKAQLSIEAVEDKLIQEYIEQESPLFEDAVASLLLASNMNPVPEPQLIGFHSFVPLSSRLEGRLNREKTLHLSLEDFTKDQKGYSFSIEKRSIQFQTEPDANPCRIHVTSSAQTQSLLFVKLDSNSLEFSYQGSYHLLESGYLGNQEEGIEDSPQIFSPVSGTLINLLVKDAQVVNKGEVLALLEAMKIEIEIKSPRDGVVHYKGLEDGMFLKKGQHLFCVDDE